MEPNPPTTNKKKRPLSDYGKYSSLAFQMAVTIAIGVWGGKKLDEWLKISDFPVFTVILSLLSLVGAMWFAVKDLLKKK